MSIEDAMVKYYADRAPQYERVYHKPERQSDLLKLRNMVQHFFTGKSVLEIACGTGYWTEIIAPVAASVLASDINEEVLAVARKKPIPSANVTFLQGDVYSLPKLLDRFDAGLAGFWWSHVSKPKLHGFLDAFHRVLEPGAAVMFFDNAYVAGSSTPLSRKDSDGNPVSNRDADGNTYQQRVLEDGSVHQIVKNFPTADELRATLAGRAKNIRIEFLTYYWILCYNVA